MRIRVLDRNFTVIASRIIVDFNVETMMGGSFSEDNKYLQFGYSFTTSTTPPGAISSNLYIFDANDPNLGTVAGPITISGFDGFDPGAALFTLLDCKEHEHLYFTFANSQNYTGDGVAAFPPFFSQVYKVVPGTVSNPGTITLADEKKQPQFEEVNSYVKKNRHEALILHGGQCTVNPAKPTVYNPITLEQIGKNPPDFNAIHIYKFDVKHEKMHLILAQEVTCCSFLQVYPPSDGTQYVLGQSIDDFLVPGDPTVRAPNPQEYYAMYNVAYNEKDKSNTNPCGLSLRAISSPSQDVKSAGTSFSQNGKYMIRYGSYGFLNDDPTLPNVDSVGINNVLLFRVTSDRYKFIEEL